MKKLLILILTFMPLLAVSQQLYVGPPKPINNIGIKNCMAPLLREQGNVSIQLGGKVRVITNLNEKADFKVIVLPNAALAVRVVEDKNTVFNCGIWRWVNKDETFSIRFVEDENDADFSITFVTDSDPGCRVCDD